MNWINYYLKTINLGNKDTLSVLDKNIILVFSEFKPFFEIIIVKLVTRVMNGEIINFDLGSILIGLIIIYKNSFEALLYQNFFSDVYKEERRTL